jgi:hypothetical protein
LKVFRYDAQARDSRSAAGKPDRRDRLLADDNLRRDFAAWLLDPVHFSELDRGTILIPDRFLATGAIAPTPVGFDSSNLQPEFGLVQGEGATANPVFSENDVVGALKKASENGVTLQNIRSVAGFERRLNDITCSGCHQTRGIGGFHFPGVDWMAAKAVQLERGAGVAAFLRRPGPPPRYPYLIELGEQPGLFAGIFQPPAIARQQRARRH